MANPLSTTDTTDTIPSAAHGYYRIEQIMRLCGLNRKALMGGVRRGTFPKPVINLSNKSRLWLREEIDAWLRGEWTAQDASQKGGER